MKKILISCIFIFLTSGCSGELSGTSNTNLTELNEGFYVLKEDVCIPLTATSLNITAPELEDKVMRGETVTLDVTEETLNNTPHLSRNESLILKTSGEISDSLPVFKLVDCGSSIGFKLDVSSTGFYKIATGSLYLESDAAAIFSGFNTSALLVTSVGGEHLAQNLLTPIGSIGNLKGGSSYVLTLRLGSLVKRIRVKADTRSFIIDNNATQFIENVEFEDDGYAKLNFDDAMESGFYYIPGTDGGIFYYDR